MKRKKKTSKYVIKTTHGAHRFEREYLCALEYVTDEPRVYERWAR